jgi:CRP-like cAMP-binding protein
MNTFTPLQDVHSVVCILAKISFLGGVSDDQRARIFRLLETGGFKKGEYISKKGEQPTHIYIIVKGRVDLLITDSDTAIKKRAFGIGDCFGEAALMSMNNNTASFVAAEDSQIVVISKRALNQLRREDLELFCILVMNIARDLARKLQYTDEILLDHEHVHSVMVPA